MLRNTLEVQGYECNEIYPILHRERTMNASRDWRCVSVVRGMLAIGITFLAEPNKSSIDFPRISTP